MRKQKVHYEAMPGIGDLFAFATGSGLTVTVVTHRSGRCSVMVGESEGDEPLVSVALTRKEAITLAALLTGAHIELIATPRT